MSQEISEETLKKVSASKTIKDFEIIDDEIGAGAFGKVMKVSFKGDPTA